MQEITERSRFVRRAAVGFLLIPLLTPIFFLLYYAADRSPDFPGDLAVSHLTELERLGSILGLFVLYSAPAFAAFLVLGAPLLILYYRLKWASFSAFLVGGAACSLTFFLLLSVPGHFGDESFGRELVGGLRFIVPIGAISGLTLRLALFGMKREPYGA